MSPKIMATATTLAVTLWTCSAAATDLCPANPVVADERLPSVTDDGGLIFTRDQAAALRGQLVRLRQWPQLCEVAVAATESRAEYELERVADTLAAQHAIDLSEARLEIENRWPAWQVAVVVAGALVVGAAAGGAAMYFAGGG